MSYKNRKFMYDKCVAEGRTEFMSEKLKDEFKNKPKDIKPIKETKKIYTDKELFDMVKAEQVIILNKLGITKIPNTETLRVKAIQEANK